MTHHHFESKHWVAAPIEHVFLFFANPANLPRIMPRSSAAQLVRLNLVIPPGVHAVISTVADQEPIAGVGSEIMVSLRVLPFLPVRMNWVSEITEFEWNHHFADIQKKGPFKSFQHRHELRAEHGGTIVRDAIDYDIGCGWLGTLANILFTKPLLRKLFQYRQKAVERLLTTSPLVR